MVLAKGGTYKCHPACWCSCWWPLHKNSLHTPCWPNPVDFSQLPQAAADRRKSKSLPDAPELCHKNPSLAAWREAPWQWQQPQAVFMNCSLRICVVGFRFFGPWPFISVSISCHRFAGISRWSQNLILITFKENISNYLAWYCIIFENTMYSRQVWTRARLKTRRFNG